MTRRILSMADLTSCPNVLKPLEMVGEVVELPAQQALLLERIGEFDGFLTSLDVETNQKVLQNAGRLQAIATASTGLDHIDVVQAEKQGIAILSLKQDTEFLSKITATAELAWALLLATVRKLPAAIVAARKGCWGRDAFRGTQISGKTLGIVGYGRLGKIVAEYGKAFRMRVLVCGVRPMATPDGVEQVDFDTLLQCSDIVSIHVHLSEDTRGFFNERVFRKMKEGSVLINTSRGAILDEDALLAALETGHLACAGLDVIEGEWRNDLQSHPLIRYANEHDNLVITPHIGGVTQESQAMAFEHTVQKLVQFFNTTAQS